MIALLLTISISYASIVCMDGYRLYSVDTGVCVPKDEVSGWLTPDSKQTPQKIVVQDESLVYLDDKNQPHRIDGPAIVHDDFDMWYIHGALGRIDGGPTLISHTQDIYIEEWVVGDWVPHRVGDPSSIGYLRDLDVVFSIYSIDGYLHRTEGPAINIYSSPERYVQISCQKGVCDKVKVVHEGAVLEFPFPHKNIPKGSSTYRFPYEIVMLCYPYIDMDTYTDESGRIHTMSVLKD